MKKFILWLFESLTPFGFIGATLVGVWVFFNNWWGMLAVLPIAMVDVMICKWLTADLAPKDGAP